MNDDELPEELDDELEEEYGESFGEMVYKSISPKVKKFLSDYYGDKFLDLEAKTYLEIETLIKEDILLFSDEIPGILYRNRTITDDDKFEEALNKFVPNNKPIKWPVSRNWFDRDFSSDEDEDEDTFLEDSDPVDLTDEQKKAKEIIEIADEIIDDTQRFAHFMKSGYEIINNEVHVFLVNNASFDLSILSSEGYTELQNQIDLLTEMLLEHLYPLMPEE